MRVTAINTSPHEERHPPNTHALASNLLVRPGTNIHSSCTSHTNTLHYTTLHYTQLHAHTDQNTPAYTTTHGTTHNNITKHAYLLCSVTVVMVVLEPKAALKAFRPASVTFLSAVCVCQQSIYPPNTHTRATCWCGPAPTPTRRALTTQTYTPHHTTPHHTPHPHPPTDKTHPYAQQHKGPLIQTNQSFKLTK